ncbi:MAG TPA: hypothetical protein VLA37_12780 [Sphingomonadaceae bacterium]|nr:hypothetical protein [Sphingomonadaceae bacterium]
MNEGDKLARNRFWVLNAVRLSGLSLVLLGIAVQYGRLEAPQWVAYALVVTGFVEFFFLPNVIAKSWRTKDR